jgi:hypothetical protein
MNFVATCGTAEAVPLTKLGKLNCYCKLNC